jgi:hypothetical protein
MDPPALDGLEPAAERGEHRLPGLVEPAELQPGVAEPLAVAPAHEQVPLHPLAGVAVRLDPVRGEVAVEQERQQQGEHLGLAGAVVAPQQQPPVPEREFLLVVEEQVDQASPHRLPAGPVRQRRAAGPPVGGREAPAVPGHVDASSIRWTTGSP